MPVYFPPLPGTANDADTVIAGQVFAPRQNLNVLAQPALQDFLGLGGSTTTPDDADTIIATQVFGP